MVGCILTLVLLLFVAHEEVVNLDLGFVSLVRDDVLGYSVTVRVRVNA
jgi:hypothetical protein